MASVAEIIGEIEIEKAFAVAWSVHKEKHRHYLLQMNNQNQVFISFPGSGTLQDWYSQTTFGVKEINLALFPSLRSIGNDEPALVNDAFQRRFEHILDNSSLAAKVDEAIKEEKEIVFAGHSSGAPIAILATLWALEKYLTPNFHGKTSLLCVTFGSPLVGNHIFSHATRRENWSRYFLHIVMRYDIVPQILLAPLSSLDQGFETISQFFNPKSESFMSESVGNAPEVSEFYFAIMSKAATVTSYAACKLMGSNNVTEETEGTSNAATFISYAAGKPIGSNDGTEETEVMSNAATSTGYAASKLMDSNDGIEETVAHFIPLSPYRPFGTYIFCMAHGEEAKQIVVTNPALVLQFMFFSAQLSTEAEIAQASNRSLREHIIHGTELQQTLGMQNLVYLDKHRDFPSSEDGAGGSTSTTNSATNDLAQLSGRATLCLWVAEELEVQRSNNERKLKKDLVEGEMKKLEQYREICKQQIGGYYDAFKLHRDTQDLKANESRLMVADVWDNEIIEKLRNYKLPDEFESKEEWIELGTRFRQLVEPLDIANYYRHLKQYDTGPYKNKGRPRRYKYTQRWLEHAQRRPHEDNPESCFWADVEDLCDNI